MAFACDYSWARPGGAALKADGILAVGRYLNDPGQKGIDAAELADLQGHGLAVFLIFESTGQDATSFANGAADGTQALQLLTALGVGEQVVYFAIDEASAPDLTDYFHGIASVFPAAKIGVYGGIDTIQAAQGGHLAAWFWQTYAWSRGDVAAGIHIYQYLNGQYVNGGSVDFDRTLQASFGQISGTVAPSTPTTPGAGDALGVNASGHPTSWVQQQLNRFGFDLVVDSILGPATTAAIKLFQRSKGLTVDGVVGPATTAALSRGVGALAVDGVYGALTCRAEQAALRVTVDGIRGPATIKAEQARTGAVQDGLDGPDTNRHLQTYLNGRVGARLVVDGVRGAATIKALQTALNEGKF